MTDNVASLEGFTRRVRIEAGADDIWCLIKPDADLEGMFKAWDTDEQEFLWFKGWNVMVYDLDD